MSTKYPGGIISKTPVTPSGPYETSTASGVWTLDQQAYWQKLSQWPTAGRPVPDPQFNYVTMLLHGDGTNGAQNNTFVDSSTNAFTITRNGNTTQGSFSPYGSNWSNGFNLVSTPDYLSVASNAAFGMGTGDYTIESWFYCTDTGGYQAIVDCRAATPATGQILFRLYASGQFYFSIQGTGTVLTSPANIALNTWVHAAVVKASGVYTLYINGTSVATASNSVSIPTSPVTIGWDQQSGNGFKGYLSNIRIVKGTAVYTSNFTPSTTPLTAVSGTSLLTCQSNRFVDNSSNAFAITVNNAPSVQRFNPFGTATAYTTSVIGGSGYFDGSGDYLVPSSNTPMDFGTGAFTIEGWVYTGDKSVSGGASRTIIGNSGNSYTMQLYIDTSVGKVVFGNTGSTNLQGTSGIANNAWHHIAVVRSGTGSNQTALFVDGTREALGTNSQNYTSGTIYLGAFGTSDGFWNGYISNLRIVKGTAVYDPTVSTLTVPTAPLTAITNTALLLNLINGAIFDNAMMNDLETVGNAQISTSVVKYGTGSLAFDGTGDYLQAPDSPVFNFGSGNWTIEGWLYINSAKNYNGFYGKRQAGQFGLTLQVDSSNVLSISASTTGSSWALAGASLGSGYSTGAWMHVAVTRSGTTITGWLNGTSTGTQTLSGSLFAATGYPATIGSSNDTGQDFNGYIDDFRITNGVARYTTTFTPPTAALPDIGPN
jgi:hypothetical protein